MRKALLCRELLGHDDYPDLLLEVEETSCTPLVNPVPLHYVRLTDKHIDEQMQPATLVGLSQRRAMIETSGPLPRFTNIMLRLDSAVGEIPPELYAKVIRPLDGSSNSYLIHFTSVPNGILERLLLLSKGENRSDK
jgi:hypothetical protein